MKEMILCDLITSFDSALIGINVNCKKMLMHIIYLQRSLQKVSK